jgi:hypothetical protein
MLSPSVYSNLHFNACQFSLLFIRTTITLHALTYSTGNSAVKLVLILRSRNRYISLIRIANSNYNTHLSYGAFDTLTGLISDNRPLLLESHDDDIVESPVVLEYDSTDHLTTV